jgi:hypothetical protein
MLEASDQIHNTVLTEPPVSEALQPDTSSQYENVLVDQIVQLWRIHLDYQASIKDETQKFHSLRDELGKHLAEMKQSLARPGRNGQWSSFLKVHKIPRATADRLVLKYERSLNSVGNCLTEQLPEPTEQDIHSLFDKFFPKLRKVLRTPQGVYRFVDLLTAASDGTQRRLTDDGLLILKPAMGPEASLSQDPGTEPFFEGSVIESQLASPQRLAELPGELM